MEVTADFSGFDEWNETLKRLAQVGQQEDLEQIVYAGGAVVEAEMKMVAQEMKIHDTGATINSIYNRTTNHSTYSQNAGNARARNPDAVLLPEKKPTGQGIQALIGPSTEYAPDIEYGNSSTAARPFVRTTLPRCQRRVMDTMNTVAKMKIEEKL